MINEKSLRNELNEIFNKNKNKNKNIKSSVIDLNKKKTILVLSGGGVKGISHLGAIQALHEQGILKNIKTYAGTSIGAFIAVLLVIGYSPNTLFQFIMELKFDKLKNINFQIFSKSYGLDEGNKLELVLGKLFMGKNINPNITLSELHAITNKTVIITAVCINDKKTYYYSHETAPNMSVIMAIKMSMAIPIYFVPVKYNGKLFIDGGCVDNYPIKIFEDKLDEVIGLYLTEFRDDIDTINNIEDYMLHMIECFFEGITYNSLKGYEKYSIKNQS